MEKKRRILFFVLMLGLIAGGIIVPRSNIVYADMPGVYQVNGEYTLTSKSLVTKCELETADDTLEKKTRTFKVTKKTKIKKDYNKKALKGKKRTAMIKKMNKKQIRIQFTHKKGKVTAIWPVD